MSSSGSAVLVSRTDRGRGFPADHVRCVFPAEDPCSQRQQLIRVADGGRQPDPLQRPPRDPGQPLKDGEQVPAAVSRRRRRAPRPRSPPGGREQPPVVHAGADQHRLQRLGRGEQQVRRAGEDGLAPGGRGVAVPEGDPAAGPAAVGLQARQQVVEQRLQRAQVERRTGRSSPRPTSGSAPGRTAASVLPPAVGASSSASSPRSTGSMRVAAAAGGASVQPSVLTRWCASVGCSRSAGPAAARSQVEFHVVGACAGAEGRRVPLGLGELGGATG